MTRIPLTWLGEYVEIAPGTSAEEVARSLVSVGLEEEGIHRPQISGPLVVGRVLSIEPEPQKNGKTINWCQVDVGEAEPRGIVCGAHNFQVGDLVVVALPGAVLPGPFPISARKTYGHISDGMICSARELELGDDHSGILVLGPEYGELSPGDDALGLLGLNEEVLEVNVTPDRGYCLSMRGIAREFGHATGAGFTDPARLDLPVLDSGFEIKLADQRPIAGVAGCDRFVARTVRNVAAAAPSPAFIQQRLQQAGMRPISLAVDVTNYVMLELGQPLHAYDLAHVSAPIVVRRARAGEKLKTIDGVVRTLDEEDLVISDSPEGEEGARLLGLAGVMGGFESEVTDATTDVLIEGAHFDATSVARTARRFRLHSEASKRFERGVDHDLAPYAVQRVVDLLVEYGGGVADETGTDVDQRPATQSLEFEVDLAGRLVGLDYSPAEIRRVLEDIGAEVQGGIDAPTWRVTPPSWRPDLVSSVDLVEEVARLRGYDAIPSRLPLAPAGSGLTGAQRVRRSISRTLAEAGLNEVLSYPFVGDATFDALQYPAEDDRRRALRILNPLRSEEPLMRTSVLATLLPILRRNVGRGLTDAAVFEVGMITHPGETQTSAPIPPLAQYPGPEALAQIARALPDQPLAVAGALAGLRTLPTPGVSGAPASWRDAVQLALRVGRAAGVELQVRSGDVAPWHPGRCAEITGPEGQVVGYAGELHPKAITALELPERTVAFELNLEVLNAVVDHEPVRAVEVSTYPAGKEDLALVVDEQVPASDVQKVIEDAAGPLIEQVRLFDVYRGPQLGEDKKSLAFALRFRAADRTLTSEDLEGVRAAIIDAATEAFGARLRS